MPALNVLLPPQANNDYRGGRVPLYVFCLLMLPMIFRSFVHFLKDDSGVNSIATIVAFSASTTGGPDPNNVIYLFSSLWGTQQLITVLIFGVVLLRYRNLIPLMYVVLIIEVFFRLAAGTLHPLDESYYVRTPPGKIGNLPLLVVSATMLFMALRRSQQEEVALPAGAEAHG